MKTLAVILGVVGIMTGYVHAEYALRESGGGEVQMACLDDRCPIANTDTQETGSFTIGGYNDDTQPMV